MNERAYLAAKREHAAALDGWRESTAHLTKCQDDDLILDPDVDEALDMDALNLADRGALTEVRVDEGFEDVPHLQGCGSATPCAIWYSRLPGHRLHDSR